MFGVKQHTLGNAPTTLGWYDTLRQARDIASTEASIPSGTGFFTVEDYHGRTHLCFTANTTSLRGQVYDHGKQRWVLFADDDCTPEEYALAHME